MVIFKIILQPIRLKIIMNLIFMLMGTVKIREMGTRDRALWMAGVESGIVLPTLALPPLISLVAVI